MSVATAPRDAPSAPAPRRRSHHRGRLVVVFALLAGAVAYLLVEGLGSSLDYFDTVGQALEHKAHLGTSVIRLEGVVVPGSVTRSASGADFEVSGDGHHVVVHDTGSPPGLFQPNIPVVVVGHFASARSDLFLSDQIMVKHSPTYIAAHPTRVRGPNGKIVR